MSQASQHAVTLEDNPGGVGFWAGSPSRAGRTSRASHPPGCPLPFAHPSNAHPPFPRRRQQPLLSSSLTFPLLFLPTCLPLLAISRRTSSPRRTLSSSRSRASTPTERPPRRRRRLDSRQQQSVSTPCSVISLDSGISTRQGRARAWEDDVRASEGRSAPFEHPPRRSLCRRVGRSPIGRLVRHGRPRGASSLWTMPLLVSRQKSSSSTGESRDVGAENEERVGPRPLLPRARPLATSLPYV